MARTRLSLQCKLEQIPGVKKVYYSPPSGIKMEYPCIRYNLTRIGSDFADNIRYLDSREYTLTVIDPNPDSTIPEELLKIPYCSLVRPYTADNLQHFLFTLYW